MNSSNAIVDLVGRGLAEHAEGRLEAAQAAYRAALEADPTSADALHLLGVAEHQLGRSEAGADLIRRAIALERAQANYHNSLSVVLCEAGLWGEAEASARAALRLQADLPGVHYNLGNALEKLGRLEEAEASYRAALRLDEDHADALNNLAHVLNLLGRFDEAEASLRRCLARRPDSAPALNNLGIALLALGRSMEAEAAYREALRLWPGLSNAHNNLGVLLVEGGRVGEAEASYREALRLEPDSADAHSNLSRCLLLTGQFAEGWRENEWRWRTRQMAAGERGFAAPQWRGEPIGGRVLMLHAEQGLGDSLQFCRYVPMIGGAVRVILEVQPPLTRLLAGQWEGVEVVTRGDPLPPFDLHCPMLSLPLAFGTDLATIPAGAPYLAADPALAAYWRTRLVGLAGLRVGLVWAGSARDDPLLAAVDARRSIPLAAMGPLGDVAGVRFISLQKGEPAEQLADPPSGMALADFTPDLIDFADTAALVANLDLVISVDTSVAHLAGAMGKPVWLLNRFDTCWRWLLGRDDSPWYPTLRQFRQSAPGDWASVMEAVRAALERAA